MKVDAIWSEMRQDQKPTGKNKTLSFHETSDGFLPEKVLGLYLPRWLFAGGEEPARLHCLVFPSVLLRDHESQRATIRSILQQFKQS